MDIKFDPVTGETVTDGNAGVEPPEKSGKGLKRLLGIIAVIAIIAIASFTLFSQFAMGREQKIAEAFKNTFKGNHLIDDIIPEDLLESDAVTVNLNTKGDSFNFDLCLAADEKEKAVSYTGRFGLDMVGVDFSARMDENEALLSIPLLSKQTFRYGFSDQNDGYLMSVLKEDGIDINEYNENAKNIFNRSDSEKEKEIMEDALKEALKKLTFEDAESKEVVIDKSVKSCKGYSVKVDEALAAEICDIFEEAVNKSEGYNETDKYIYEGENVFSAIKEIFKDGALEVRFYIYDKKIAAIELVWDGKTISVEFNSGDDGIEAISILRDEELLAEITKSVANDTETAELKVGGRSLIKYDYNLVNGDLSIVTDVSLLVEEYDTLEIKGNIAKSDESITYTISGIDGIEEGDGFTGSMEIKKGADIAEIDKTDVFDIGKATEEEWQGIKDSIAPLLQGNHELNEDFDDIG